MKKKTINKPNNETDALTLADIPPHGSGTVTGFKGLSAAQQEQLQAYGLSPGRRFWVLQHQPVTVIQVEYTELAFEVHVAKGVLVKLNENNGDIR